MQNKVGIWLDHEKAFVVYICEGQESTAYIESNVEGHYRLSGGSRSSTPYGPQEGPSEGKIEQRRDHHLRNYYRKIIRTLGDAERVYILGPGEAKTELGKEIRKSKSLASKIVKIEPADKMTERQIAAKVRGFFADSRNS